MSQYTSGEQSTRILSFSQFLIVKQLVEFTQQEADLLKAYFEPMLSDEGTNAFDKESVQGLLDALDGSIKKSDSCIVS